MEVKINNEIVDIAPNSPLAMSWVSPYLLYDSIPSVSIKPPNFPFSPTNQRIFQYFHEPHSDFTMPEFSFLVSYHGELLREGFYRMQSSNANTGFNGTFTEKLDEFFGEFQTKQLSEIGFGSLALPTTLTASPINDLGMAAGGSPACCFPTILNSDYYGTSGTSYTGKMNDHNGTNYVANSPLVPMFFTKYIIAKIAQLTNTTITGTFLTSATWQNLIMFHTRALDGATSIDVSKYMPELTVESLFLELRKLPNIAFTFNTVDHILTIDFWEDKLQAPTMIDWSAKAVKGETKVVEQNTRIQLSYELDGGDALMKDKPAATMDYVTAQFAGQTYTGIAPIKSKFSTLLVDAGTGLATVKQVGITTTNNQLTAKCSPRLLFWNGLVGGKPVALPTLNSSSLYWVGANGLAAKHWSFTEKLRSQQFYLKKQINLSEIDLANLDFAQKVHINGVDYLVAQVDVVLPIEKPADVLLIGGV